MDEKEKSQKTIIAVITGLLIGGLLVWIFSAAPDDATPEENADTDTAAEEGVEVNDTTDEQTDEDTADVSTPTATGGSITVNDQAAGAVVNLASVEYPHNAGWIVVREELAGGVLGNILGASRFNKAEGLNPTRVELLRNTEAGKTYHVIAYTENGDRVFDLADDVPVTLVGGALVATTFTAQYGDKGGN